MKQKKETKFRLIIILLFIILLNSCIQGERHSFNTNFQTENKLPKVDQFNNTLYHQAILQKRLNSVNFLTIPPDEINKTNFLGNSILHVAYSQGNSKLASQLIAQGADQKLANRFGTYPRALYGLNLIEDKISLKFRSIDTKQHTPQYYDQLAELASSLKSYDENLVVNALFSQIIQNNSQNKYSLLVLSILLGYEASKEFLVEYLEEYGDIKVALLFLNSGSFILQMSGKAWGIDNGYMIKTKKGNKGKNSTWGSLNSKP